MNEKIRSKDDLCAGEYNCRGYLEVVKMSKRFVDKLMIKAVWTVAKMKQSMWDHDWPEVDPDITKWSEYASEPSNSPENKWPTCGSINILNAQESIKQLMDEWKSITGLEDWMYNVEFIALKADQTSDYFLYEVKWSIPTPEYPIPQVTASVFFSIEASRVRSMSCPVDVTYVFEGTQFVHRPEIPFRQKWLYDILDVKTLMFKSFRF